MPLEWLDAVDGKTRREFVRQDQVVADRRTDIDKAAIGGQTSDQDEEDLFFFRFVEVARLVAFALLFEEPSLKTAAHVAEGVEGAGTGQGP